MGGPRRADRVRHHRPGRARPGRALAGARPAAGVPGPSHRPRPRGGRAVSRRALSLILAVLVPLLCGAAALASLSGRVDHLDRLATAVVNLDEMVTGADGRPVAAGRLLAAGLTAPDRPADAALDWRLTDAADARDGLADGTYAAVVTIPKDFSATIAALGDGTPGQARVLVTGNDASSALTSLLAEQVTATAAATVGHTVTTSYVAGLLGGVDDVGSALGGAADGADQLAEGAAAAADGAAKVDGGARDLAAGIGSLAGGATALADGAASASAGAANLATGLGTLRDKTATLPDQTAALADGAAALDTGLGSLKEGAAALPGQTRTLADGASQVSAGAGTLATSLSGLSEQCAAAGGSAEFCAALGQAATAAGTLDAGAGRVATGAGALADA
ncbi:hypothetical protein GB883_17100, partial [Georgenia thermotolerans]